MEWSLGNQEIQDFAEDKSSNVLFSFSKISNVFKLGGMYANFKNNKHIRISDAMMNWESEGFSKYEK